MSRVRTAILSLATAGAFLAAMPAHAQSECAVDNPAQGQEKITGQITGGPTGSLIEVTSESGSILVDYNSSVLVCQGGQPASASVLALHATVVAYGPVKKKGKTLQMTATKILVAEPSRVAMQPSAQIYGSSAAKGGVSAQDDWNSPQASTQPSGGNGGQATAIAMQQTAGSDRFGAGTRVIASNGGGSEGGNVVGQSDGLDSTGGSKVAGENQNVISCNAIQFSVGSSRDSATGMASGKTTTSGITCKIPVDKQALEFVEFAASNRRLATTTLNWQNQLTVVLTNPEVSNVLFTWDGTAQVVEVTFNYQRSEVTYTPSGTRVTF